MDCRPCLLRDTEGLHNKFSPQIAWPVIQGCAPRHIIEFDWCFLVFVNFIVTPFKKGEMLRLVDKQIWFDAKSEASPPQRSNALVNVSSRSSTNWGDNAPFLLLAKKKKCFSKNVIKVAHQLLWVFFLLKFYLHAERCGCVWQRMFRLIFTNI